MTVQLSDNSHYCLDCKLNGQESKPVVQVLRCKDSKSLSGILFIGGIDGFCDQHKISDQDLQNPLCVYESI